MILEILSALYLFLPAYIANMMPVFAARLGILRFLDISIDAGFSLGGKALFGRNKTVRGFVLGVTGGLVVGVFQFFFAEEMRLLSLLSYDNLAFSLALAFLLSFGALVGDSVKSFLKRRIGKKPGSQWLFADQIDYVLGGLLFMLPVYRPSLFTLSTILIFSPIATAVANVIGYWINVKKVWW